MASHDINVYTVDADGLVQVTQVPQINTQSQFCQKELKAEKFSTFTPNFHFENSNCKFTHVAT